MGKRAKFSILTVAFLEIGLAVFALVPTRMVKLLNLIMCKQTTRFPTVRLRALNVRVRYEERITATIAFTVMMPTCSVLIIAVMGDRTWLSFEGSEIESEKFGCEELGVISRVNVIAVWSVLAVVIGAVGSLIHEGMIVKFPHIMILVAVLIQSFFTA